VRRDNRPYLIKRAYERLEQWYTERFIRPQLDGLGDHYMIMQPWYLDVHGPNIHLGHQVHVITAEDRHVRLTVWRHDDGVGHIDIGDYALVCPGVRIDSAAGVKVGANTMIAAGAYLTDADWHDVYDRTRAIGNAAPITLEDNVWIGDGATVCKGVTVGENSVVAASAVVPQNVPPNVIVAGNPAKVVKELDPDRPIRKRAALLHDPVALADEMDRVDRYLLQGNGWFGWLRSLVGPTRED
jgi:acetyltransferase-like isoleucine patch superfamily enzyme